MKLMMKRSACILGILGTMGFMAACGGGENPLEFPPIPPEYANKHMPEGWWADPKIVEEGKKIFMGETNIDVNCSSCHGKDGKPVKRGARDFRRVERMSMYSDSFWFWRISEGVPHTKMKPWKEKLSEEERWKVMAFEHAFSHGGQPAAHDDYKPAAAPTGGSTGGSK